LLPIKKNLFFAFSPWLAQQENQLIILSGVVLLTRNGRKSRFLMLEKYGFLSFLTNFFVLEKKVV